MSEWSECSSSHSGYPVSEDLPWYLGLNIGIFLAGQEDEINTQAYVIPTTELVVTENLFTLDLQWILPRDTQNRWVPVNPNMDNPNSWIKRSPNEITLLICIWNSVNSKEFACFLVVPCCSQGATLHVTLWCRLSVCPSSCPVVCLWQDPHPHPPRNVISGQLSQF